MIKRIFLFILVAGAVLMLWARLNKRSLDLDEAVKTEQALITELETNGLGKLKLSDLDGRELIYSGSSDGPFILHFWATWCGPCVSEIPSIAKLSKVKPKYRIWAISADDSKDEVLKFLKAFSEVSEGNLNIAVDLDKELTRKYLIEKLPETFIFSKDGKLKRRIVGATEWMNSEVVRYLESLE